MNFHIMNSKKKFFIYMVFLVLLILMDQIVDINDSYKIILYCSMGVILEVLLNHKKLKNEKIK